MTSPLLASVSRSFYLTLKALPAELREPISLGYLLARTADTLADTAEVPASVRLACLSDYRTLAQTPGTGQGHAETEALASTLRQSFIPHQSDAAEATLLEQLPEALSQLQSLPAPQQHAIRQVLQPIIEGQSLDIQRFPNEPAGQLHSLATAAELERYTYLVAGCVGEFWTQLCLTQLPASNPAFLVSAQPEMLLAQGIAFGQGLQLINILRDLHKDARLGRCYLPSEEWQRHGLSLADIQRDPFLLWPVCQPWIAKAEAHLQSGLSYLQAVQHKGLRYATALPLLLGTATLKRLRSATCEGHQQGIKISRLEVSKILFDTMMHNTPEGLVKLNAKLAS